MSSSCLDFICKILDVVSLMVQLIGAYVMYKNSPVNRITGTTFGGSYDPVPVNRKNKQLERGFAVLAIGIGIALLSLLLKDFVPTGI